MAEATVERPTKATERARMERTIEEWSKDHVSTASEEGRVLDFRKPGTGVYAIRYRIDGPFLLVYGDVGDGIYQWSSALSWGFLAGCGFGYFAEKCQASAQGRRPRGWDPGVAEHNLRDMLEQEEETWEGLGADFRPMPDLSSLDMWLEWLRDYGDDALGPDWWEWAPKVGEVPDIHQLAHWKMLLLAVERMPKEATSETERLGWRPIEHFAPPEHAVFLAYGPELQDDDFCPDGIVEAFWSPGDDGKLEIVGAVWDTSFDCWMPRPIDFTHWSPLPAPPTETDHGF